MNGLGCNQSVEFWTVLYFCSVRWFSLRFQEITFAKNVGETKGFFCFSRNKNLTFFAYVMFWKRRENQRKKKYREMFSYQFVAHMPKIRQI